MTFYQPSIFSGFLSAVHSVNDFFIINIAFYHQNLFVSNSSLIISKWFHNVTDLVFYKPFTVSLALWSIIELKLSLFSNDPILFLYRSINKWNLNFMKNFLLARHTPHNAYSQLWTNKIIKLIRWKTKKTAKTLQKAKMQ